MKKSLFNKRIRKLYISPQMRMITAYEDEDVLVIGSGKDQPWGGDVPDEAKQVTPTVIYIDDFEEDEDEENKPYNPYDALTL